MILRLALSVLLALLACGLAAEAPAHTRSASYSSWQLAEDGARVRVRIPLLELTRLPPELLPDAADPVGQYLAERLVLRAGTSRCPRVEAPVRLTAAEGWAVYEWHLRCDSGPPDAIESAILLEVAPSHLHFARVRGAGIERVLTSAAPTFPIGNRAASESDETTAGTTLSGYVGLGVEHILTGWDHLAFVLALLLLAGTLRELAGLVTSFTLAHSITLALAVLGWVHPDGVAVEALIGYSIALVAAENSWLLAGRGRAVPAVLVLGLAGLTLAALAGRGAVPALALAGTALFTLCHFGLLERAERPARLRAAVAFAFGLVHGFGFAGVLSEMELPTERLASALFGFNVGVELGQLGVVLVLWPLLRALARIERPGVYRLSAETASAAICGLGLFWFLTRSFG